MLKLFFANIENEFKPMLCIAPVGVVIDKFPTYSHVLLNYRGKVVKGTMISTIFDYDSRYRDMLERHYGIDELPRLVGTWSYVETLFDVESM